MSIVLTGARLTSRKSPAARNAVDENGRREGRGLMVVPIKRRKERSLGEMISSVSFYGLGVGLLEAMPL